MRYIMKYGVQKLRKKLDCFFSDQLSKQELGKWAENAYFDLLKGGYVETSKIEIYPFIKIISQFHVEINDLEDKYPCSEERVKEIQSILYGKQDYEFQMEVAIPSQVYSMFEGNENFNRERYAFFLNFRAEIRDYLNSSSLDNNTLQESLNFLFNMEISHDTLQGILERRIITICKALFGVKIEGIYPKTNLKIYAVNSSRTSLTEKLIECIDCYVGEKSFNVIASFQDGIPDLMLLT